MPQNDNKQTDKSNANQSDEDTATLCCIDDFEQIAGKKLTKTVYDYYRRGADEEQTLAFNREMYSRLYCLKPRCMINVANVSLTRHIFGDKIGMPIGISPTAMHKLAHTDGELATIRACKRANSVMILSLFSTTSLEEIANAEPMCPKWQNVYILKNRELTKSVINRAKRFGYRAIVVTCDAPTLGKRRNDEKNNLQLGKYKLVNIDDPSAMSMKDHAQVVFDPSVTWQDLADVKKFVGETIRIIAKGILTADDAEQALEAGVDAIFVSNHGGRQLDGCRSTIEALPEIVKVVNKRCPVFVDGGIRTGADVMKALALGADMVFVGRPVLWGLAVDGEEGVYKVLKMLEDELKRTMMFCGCTKLDDINSSIIIERLKLADYNV